MVSLAKLENENIKLFNENARLKNLLSERKEKYRHIQIEFDKFKSDIQNIIKNEVEKSISIIKKEYEEIINKKDNEIARLNAKIGISSSNSSIPTSMTPIGKNKLIPNSRVKSDKHISGQPKHSKHKLNKFNDDEVTEHISHIPSSCSCGCTNLTILNDVVSKDELDFEVVVKKIRNDFYSVECNDCQKTFRLPITTRLKEDNQYGENVQALAVTLTNETFTPINKTRKLIDGITNNEIVLSEGYISKLQKRAYGYLDKFITDLKTEIMNQRILHWDDTVIMINTKRACMRFYGNNKLALYVAHEQKNKDGIIEDNILPLLSKDTTVIHDHLTLNYDPKFVYTNAECNEHLIRDLKDIFEKSKHDWGTDLISLLSETNKLRNEYILEGKKKFDKQFIEELHLKYDEILSNGIKQNIIDRALYYGNEEKSLLTRIDEYKDAYLLWVTDFEVPFTNNLSERSLRGLKSKMKISGQFQNIMNAEYHAYIKSYIETCKRADINIFVAIKNLMNGNPFSVSYILNFSKQQ